MTPAGPSPYPLSVVVICSKQADGSEEVSFPRTSTRPVILCTVFVVSFVAVASCVWFLASNLRSGSDQEKIASRKRTDLRELRPSLGGDRARLKVLVASSVESRKMQVGLAVYHEVLYHHRALYRYIMLRFCRDKT